MLDSRFFCIDFFFSNIYFLFLRKLKDKACFLGKPVIKKGLSDKHAFENDTNVEVSVEATGTPAPEVKW